MTLDILVAAVASFIFGWLYYSPALFGNLWLKYSNISKAKAKAMHKKGMGGKMLVGFISSVITAWILSLLLAELAVTDVAAALDLTWKVWLGFVAATTLIGGVLWEGKSMNLFFLNAIYWLVNIGIMAAVLVAFV